MEKANESLGEGKYVHQIPNPEPARATDRGERRRTVRTRSANGKAAVQARRPVANSQASDLRRLFRVAFPIGVTSTLTSRRRGLDRTEASPKRR